MYELLARGDLPYVPAATSKGYRIDPDDLDDFIRRRKVRNKGRESKAPRRKFRIITL